MARWSDYTTGERLKILRGSGLTQERLAEAAGLSVATIRKAERDLGGGIAVKVLEGIAAGEHTERSLILDLALALAEDRRRDIARKTKNGLDAARRRGRVGGRRPVVDDDKRAAILARRQRGESIRTIAAGVKVSVGVVHKTLAEAQPEAQQEQ